MMTVYSWYQYINSRQALFNGTKYRAAECMLDCVDLTKYCLF